MTPAARELRVLNEALEALAVTTGLHATVTHEPRLQPHADATIQIDAAGKRFRFIAEIKTIDRAVALAAVKHRLAPYRDRALLIAPHVTPELANHCRVLRLNFIDTGGNAFLRAPGLYVFVRGERPRTLTEIDTRGGGRATALRVIFALLCRPHLLNAPYRQIATAAGVALGAVGWVFFDLQKRHYIAGAPRRGNRRLLEAGRLLEEWVANFPTTLRPKLNARRFNAPDPGWWEKAHFGPGVCWGGEVAAARLTGHLRPATYTIYVDPRMAQEAIATLVKQHRLRAVPEGNLEILDRFWNFDVTNAEPDLAPPILIYADLMRTLDPRNLEIAKQLREEHIDDAIRRL
jgi:hypothetical protein